MQAQKRETVLGNLSIIITELKKQSKRILKKNVPKSNLIRVEVRDNLVALFNEFTKSVASSWQYLDNTDRQSIKTDFHYIRDKVIRSFQTLGVKYQVPVSCVEQIDILSLEEESQDEDETIMPMTTTEFFNLASKIIPNQFDGNVDNFRSFLDSLELLQENSADHQDRAVSFVKTRLAGKARNLISDGDGLNDIARKLKNALKGESSNLLTSKLLNLRQNHKDTSTYAAEVEQLAQKLQNAFISEGVPNEVAEKYAVQTTSRALSQNSNTERARIVIEAGNFSTVQEIMTKFLNVNTQPSPANNVFYMNNNNNSRNRHPFNNNRRGSGRNFQNSYNGFRNSHNFNAGRGQYRFAGNRYNNNSRPNGRGNGQTNANVRFLELSNQGNQSDPQPVRLGETEQ